MGAQELARLSRELRARAELTEPEDWAAGPAAGAAGPTGAREALALLQQAVASCRLCALGSQRLNAAFGVGSPEARVMLIGEGPGYEEDRQGVPFVGPAGQLLDKILASIGLSRDTVYITNIVKCHPMEDPSDPGKRGNDRPPSPEESAACRPYLDEQIRLVRPEALVTLGAPAAKVLLATQEGITRLRGRWREYQPAGGEPIPLLPTYHPAYLLRDPSKKSDTWTDMKELKKFLER
ncbi:MAG TPA: uracil-DNA glycosylase [Elusimicrobia bacterium]|nr:uracil-DNA glycosylase [Elusimicrobiota bacterium]